MPPFYSRVLTFPAALHTLRGIDVNHRDLAYHYRKKGPPKWAGLTDMAESVVGQRRHSVQSFSIASKGRFPSLPSVKPTPVLLVGRLLVVIGRNSVGHSEKSHGWQERNYGALHLCAKEGNTKLLQLLLQYGADVDLPAWVRFPRLNRLKGIECKDGSN